MQFSFFQEALALANNFNNGKRRDENVTVVTYLSNSEICSSRIKKEPELNL